MKISRGFFMKNKYLKFCNYTAQVANLDKKFEDAYRDAGVELVYMSEKDHAAWIEIAKKTSHKAFAEQVPGGAKLMEMALAVK